MEEEPITAPTTKVTNILSYPLRKIGIYTLRTFQRNLSGRMESKDTGRSKEI
jgi:hypothetical protein